MKNIHLIPTDKPSRLHLGNSGLVLCDLNFGKNTINGQNIYITNSEEINERDWVVTPNKNIMLVTTKYATESSFMIGNSKHKGAPYYIEFCRKIILTTDQDLIAEGVQAIDDEFLEWFVKNPSCESVEIDLVPVNEFGSEITVGGYGFDKFIYKIIYKIIIPQSEPKQETLEEAAERILWDNTGMLIENHPTITQSMIDLAKWQAKRSYSKEDMKQAFFDGIRVTGEGYNGEYASGNHPDIEVEFYESYIEWFKQFKKK